MTIRRFVVGVDDLEDAADREFREFLREFRAGFWHWIPNFWLITTSDEDISAQKISYKLKELGAKKRNLVLEIPEDEDWAGWGQNNAKGRSMFEWIETTWADEPKK
jgi:hypothetical protein